jgi:hypothetical protein
VVGNLIGLSFRVIRSMTDHQLSLDWSLRRLSSGRLFGALGTLTSGDGVIATVTLALQNIPRRRQQLIR